MSWPCRTAPSFILLQSALCLVEPHFLRILIAAWILAFDELQREPGTLNWRKIAGLFLLPFTNEFHATTAIHLVSPGNPPTSVEDPVYTLLPAPQRLVRRRATTICSTQGD
ncbi:MAG TPA: hypothetical protein VNQ14_02230 [Woeseiaceae bacterium]|nr:hypothetical protein [Woeseiaceae bacterium]